MQAKLLKYCATSYYTITMSFEKRKNKRKTLDSKLGNKVMAYFFKQNLYFSDKTTHVESVKSTDSVYTLQW